MELFRVLTESVKRQKVRWAIVIFSAIALLLVVLFLYVNRNQFHDSYRKLEINMTFQQARDILMEEPALTVYSRSFRVCYFDSRMTAEPRISGAPPSGATVDWRELPDPYGYVQLAFSEDDSLVAYTWIGEEYYIHTLSGKIEGSNISLVEESMLFGENGNE